VILSQGDKLVLDDLPQYQQPSQVPVQLPNETLTEQDCRQMQYQATLDALVRTGGKIYGVDGAAQLLGIKPTTLASRLKKLGINRQQLLAAYPQ
jgi:transcriptional regulator with GAF, ATPase, and Fis domain